DGYDERTRTGWSVLINGRARAVYEAAEIQRLNRLGLRPWAGAAGRPFWIRIRPATISGRRIPDPDAAEASEDQR
ncbi:MAG TPA: pyridoxamine 5'-phosphate oxidase family protein, partial [Streptosporangiaceae bacterium]